MFIKEISSMTLMLAVLVAGFAYLEPNVVGAQSDDDEIIVSLTVDSGISITAAPDVTMSNMSVTVNNSTGWAVWNVKTNSAGGYTLGVKASTTPAMRNGTNSFEDYSEATPGTPDVWSVDSGKYEFGFSGLGSDVVNVNSDQYAATGQTVCDNGSASSTVNATLRYLGFTTSDQTLASRSSTTTPSGVDTRVCFAAGQNGAYAPSGLYQATITATATAI